MPTITPLIRECASQDTIFIPINPMERPGTPRTAREILDRANEVSFNAVTLKELKMIALLRQVADPGNTLAVAQLELCVGQAAGQAQRALALIEDVVAARLEAHFGSSEPARAGAQRAKKALLAKRLFVASEVAGYLMYGQWPSLSGRNASWPGTVATSL